MGTILCKHSDKVSHFSDSPKSNTTDARSDFREVKGSVLFEKKNYKLICLVLKSKQSLDGVEKVISSLVNDPWINVDTTKDLVISFSICEIDKKNTISYIKGLEFDPDYYTGLFFYVSRPLPEELVAVVENNLLGKVLQVSKKISSMQQADEKTPFVAPFCVIDFGSQFFAPSDSFWRVESFRKQVEETGTSKVIIFQGICNRIIASSKKWRWNRTIVPVVTLESQQTNLEGRIVDIFHLKDDDGFGGVFKAYEMEFVDQTDFVWNLFNQLISSTFNTFFRTNTNGMDEKDIDSCIDKYFRQLDELVRFGGPHTDFFVYWKDHVLDFKAIEVNKKVDEEEEEVEGEDLD